MSDFPTYYDIKFSKPSLIFEAEEIKGLTEEQVAEAERTYNILVEKLQKGEPIEESLFGGLLAAGASAVAGPTVMRALMRALGIDENGTLGKLLTSKLVLASIAYTMAR